MDIAETLRCAKLLIDNKNFDGAKALLDSVPEENRNNEWYYFFGVASAGSTLGVTDKNKNEVAVNASVVLGFKKHEKNPMLKISREKFKKTIKVVSICFSLVLSIVLACFLIISIYDHVEWEITRAAGIESLSRKIEENQNYINQYKAQYDSNHPTFFYVEESPKLISEAIAKALDYGKTCEYGCIIVEETYSYHSVQYSLVAELLYFRTEPVCTRAQIDNLNAMWTQLYSGTCLNDDQLEFVQRMLDFFAVLREIKPFYNGVQIDWWLGQEQMLYVLCAWNNHLIEKEFATKELNMIIK